MIEKSASTGFKPDRAALQRDTRRRAPIRKHLNVVDKMANSNSIIIWLFATVLAVSASLVLTYHLVSSARSGSPIAVNAAQAASCSDNGSAEADMRCVELEHSAAAKEALRNDPF